MSSGLDLDGKSNAARNRFLASVQDKFSTWPRGEIRPDADGGPCVIEFEKILSFTYLMEMATAGGKRFKDTRCDDTHTSMNYSMFMMFVKFIQGLVERYKCERSLAINKTIRKTGDSGSRAVLVGNATLDVVVDDEDDRGATRRRRRLQTDKEYESSDSDEDDDQPREERQGSHTEEVHEFSDPEQEQSSRAGSPSAPTNVIDSMDVQVKDEPVMEDVEYPLDHGESAAHDQQDLSLVEQCSQTSQDSQRTAERSSGGSSGGETDDDPEADHGSASEMELDERRPKRKKRKEKSKPKTKAKDTRKTAAPPIDYDQDDVVFLIEEICRPSQQASTRECFSEMRSITRMETPVGYTFWVLLRNTGMFNIAAYFQQQVLSVRYSQMEVRKFMDQDPDEDDDDGNGDSGGRGRKRPKRDSSRYFNDTRMNSRTQKMDFVCEAYKLINPENAVYAWQNYGDHPLGDPEKQGAHFARNIMDGPMCYTNFFSSVLGLRIRSGADYSQSFTRYITKGDIYMEAGCNNVGGNGLTQSKHNFTIPADITDRFFRVNNTEFITVDRMPFMYFPFAETHNTHIMERLYPSKFSVDSCTGSTLVEKAVKPTEEPHVDPPIVSGTLFTDYEFHHLNEFINTVSVRRANVIAASIAHESSREAGADDAELRNAQEWGRHVYPLEDSNSVGCGLSGSGDASYGTIELEQRGDSFQRQSLTSSRTLALPEHGTSNSCSMDLMDCTKNINEKQLMVLRNHQLRKEARLVHKRWDAQMKRRSEWKTAMMRVMQMEMPKLVLSREDKIMESCDKEQIMRVFNPLGDARALFKHNSGYSNRAMTILEIGSINGAIKNAVMDMLNNNRHASPKERSAIRTVLALQSTMEYATKCANPNCDISDGAKIVQGCIEQQRLYDVSTREIFENIDPDLSPGTMVLARMLDSYFTVFNMVNPPVILTSYLSILSGFHARFDLRVHILMLGPPGKGKSEHMKMVEKLLCSVMVDSTLATMFNHTTAASEKHMGSNTYGKNNNIVQMCNETDPQALEGYNKNPTHKEGNHIIKDTLDTGKCNMSRLNYNKEISEWIQETSTALYMCTFVFLANFGVGHLHKSVLRRLLVMLFVENGLSKLKMDDAVQQEHSKRSIDLRYQNLLTHQHRTLCAMVFDVYQMIHAGAMDRVTSWLPLFVIQHVNQVLTRHKMRPIEISDSARIVGMCETVCILEACASEFMMRGGVFTNENITTDRLRMLNDKLYVTVPQVTMVMGLMMPHIYSECRRDLRATLLYIYRNARKRETDPKAMLKYVGNDHRRSRRGGGGGGRSGHGMGMDATRASSASTQQENVMPSMVETEDDERDFSLLAFNPEDRAGTVEGRFAKMVEMASKNAPHVKSQWSREHFEQVIAELLDTPVVAYDIIPNPDYTEDATVDTTARQGRETTVLMRSGNLMLVCASWLLGKNPVDEAELVERTLIELFSSRHQPPQKVPFGTDVCYPNTFKMLNVGNEDCDSERLPVIERQNIHAAPSMDVDAIYGKLADDFRRMNDSCRERINMALNEVVVLVRRDEIHHSTRPVTERDMAKALYVNGTRLFGFDPASPIHKRNITSRDLAALDNEVDRQTDRSRYVVRNMDGSYTPQWRLCFPTLTDKEAERMFFDDMRHTLLEIVKDRLLRATEFEAKQTLSKVGYPQVFRLRFMDRKDVALYKDISEIMKCSKGLPKERENAYMEQVQAARDALMTLRTRHKTFHVKTPLPMEPDVITPAWSAGDNVINPLQIEPVAETASMSVVDNITQTQNAPCTPPSSQNAVPTPKAAETENLSNQHDTACSMDVVCSVTAAAPEKAVSEMDQVLTRAYVNQLAEEYDMY